jgi:hypothetical protein
VTTSLTPGSERALSNVIRSKLSPSPSRMKGLGLASRETGQSREPLPPERITGTSIAQL